MKDTKITLRRAVNLRPDAVYPGAAWRAAGQPKLVANGQARPFARLRPEGFDADVTLFTRGATLCALVGEWGEGQVQTVGLVAGRPIGARRAARGLVAVLRRHAAPVYLAHSSGGGAFTLLGEMPALPPLALVAADETTLHAAVGPVALSGTSPRSGSLTDADARALSAQVASAYSRLCGEAADTGLYPQPVLARWRVVDAAGATLALGPVTLLCHVNGFQCCGQFSLTSTDGLQTLAAGALTCGAFRPRLVVGGALPSPWCDVAARVVVEATGPLHFVDASRRCPNRVSSGGSTSTVAYRLPGLSGMAASDTSVLRSLVTGCLGCLDALMRPVASLALPYRAAGVRTLPMPSQQAPQTAADLLRRTVAKSEAAPGGSSLSSLSSVPSLSSLYSVVQPLSGLTFCANPVTPAVAPPSAFSLANRLAAVPVSGQSGAWSGGAWAELSDGTTTSASCAGDAPATAPLRLSPLLVVGSAEAGTLTVGVETPVGLRQQTFDLQPLGPLGAAFYLAPDLCPVEMPLVSGSSLEVPASTAAGSEEPGRVDVFAPSSASVYGVETLAGTFSVGAEVVALREAPRAQSSWDFSRLKLVVMGRGGIHLAKIEATGRVGAFALLDPRPVASAEAVCTASGADGAVLAAIAGGDLVNVGSRRVATLLPRCGASRVGYCPAFGEYWLNAPLRRLLPSGRVVEVDFAVLTDDTEFFTSASNRLMLSVPALSAVPRSPQTSETPDPTGGTTARACVRCADVEETPASGVRVMAAWDAARADTAPLRPRCLTARMMGASLSATVTLSGHDGSEIPSRLARFTLSGDVNAPLRAALLVPARRFLGVECAATGVSPADFSLLPPLLD